MTDDRPRCRLAESPIEGRQSPPDRPRLLRSPPPIPPARRSANGAGPAISVARPPPLTYRLEFRGRGPTGTTLLRAGLPYVCALRWAVRLGRRLTEAGLDGELRVVEDAFGMLVARRRVAAPRAEQRRFAPLPERQQPRPGPGPAPEPGPASRSRPRPRPGSEPASESISDPRQEAHDR